MLRRSIPLALLTLACCDEDKRAPAPAPSRVVAVAAQASKDEAAALCDVRFSADKAPAFALPPVAGAHAEGAGGARWVNVWATWCPPCVEELPRLRRATAELARAGLPVSLVLLSVDADPADVARFEAAHPEARGSLRLTDAGALEPWVTSLGLDRGATLPMHVFVDPAGKVRCARTGAIGDADLAAVRAILSAR